MKISQELLTVLACPQCKGDLEYSAEPVGLLCQSCELLYSIREDGVPVMLVDQALSIPAKKSD